MSTEGIIVSFKYLAFLNSDSLNDAILKNSESFTNLSLISSLVRVGSSKLIIVELSPPSDEEESSLTRENLSDAIKRGLDIKISMLLIMSSQS